MKAPTISISMIPLKDGRHRMTIKVSRKHNGTKFLLHSSAKVRGVAMALRSAGIVIVRDCMPELERMIERNEAAKAGGA